MRVRWPLLSLVVVGAKPMIAKRVVHETAAILDDLEKRFPLAK